MRWIASAIITAAFVLSLASGVFADDYNASTTTNIYGTNTTSPTYLNANDSQYYNVTASSSSGSNTTLTTNPGFNGNVDNWTNGFEEVAPGSNNAFTYDAATYVSSPGSGQKYMRPDASQDNTLLSGTAYQSLSSSIDQATTNWFNFSLKFDSLSNTGAVDWAAVCTELYGTVNGTAGSRLYYCYAVDGSLPSDNASFKYVSLGSGTNTSWQSFSRNVTADVDAEWAAGTNYSFTEVRLVNRMLTGTVGSSTRPAFYSHFDDIYVKKEPKTYAISIVHQSAAMPDPSLFTYDNVSVSLTMKSSATLTYALTVYNFNNASWDSCASQSVGTSPVTMSCTKTANASYYINATSPSMTVKLDPNSSSSFVSSEDYLVFRANGTPFAAYNTSLLIWDSTGTTPAYPNQTVYFYANYSNQSNNASIDATGVCKISFDVGGWTAWSDMVWNATSGLYNYNRSFNASGAYWYNVSCSKTKYQSQTATTIVYIGSTGSWVRTDKPKYYNCPSVVYYKVTMNGSSYYDFLINTTSGATAQYFHNLSSPTFLGSYVLGPFSESGNWSAVVTDLVWNMVTAKQFTVKSLPQYNTIGILSDHYIAIMDSSSARMNIYVTSVPTSCNVTVNNAGGSLGLNTALNITSYYSSTMSGLGSFSYPAIVRVQCNASAVVARDPDSEGLIIFTNDPHIGKQYYGITTSEGYAYIGAPYGALNYTIVLRNSDGSVKSSSSGSLAANASVEAHYPNARGGMDVLTTADSLVYYRETHKSLTLPYSGEQLLTYAFSPFYDYSGTNIYIYSPSNASNVTMKFYPYFGCKDCPEGDVLCVVNISIAANNRWSSSFSGAVGGCSFPTLYDHAPAGVAVYNSTGPIAVSTNVWASSSALTSPIYNFGSFYLTNYFVTNSTSMNYLVFTPTADTNVTVNGANIGLKSTYYLTAGSVSSNRLNITANKHMASSVGYGSGESIVIAYGQ